MKINFLLSVFILVIFSLSGCGTQDGSSDVADATELITDGFTVSEIETTLSSASVGDLQDLGDSLNEEGEEWFFASTIDVNSSGKIIGESPGNHLILWNPAEPDTLVNIPTSGTYYDDYYNLTESGGSDLFVAYEVLEINDAGLVIGNRYVDADRSRGFVWNSTTGVFIDLAPPNFLNDDGKREFSDYSKAVDINEKGAVLLTVETQENGNRVAYWDGSSYTIISDLSMEGSEDDVYVLDFQVPSLQFPTEILNSEGSEAVALNDNGQIVSSSANSGFYYDFTIRGWAALNTLDGATTATPIAINNNKHIVGVSGNEGFFWRGGVMYPISNPTGAEIEIVGINNYDIVLGNSDGQAFIWSIDPVTENGVFTPIGTLGGASSTAVAINDWNEVVGYSTTGNSYSEGNITSEVEHAFLWKDAVMYDLGAHSPPNYDYPFDPDFYFSRATAISESGIITGQSISINAHSRGFTLMPIYPE